MASIIRIIRESSWYASGLPLRVYIDDNFVGNVARNEYVDFTVSADINHAVQVKIDIFRSPKTTVKVPHEKSAIFRIGMPAMGDWTSLVLTLDREILVLSPISTDYRV